MIKGLFIYYKVIDYTNLTGIDKKVLWQIEGLNNQDMECRLLECAFSGKSCFYKFIMYVIARLPFTNVAPRWEWKNEFGEVDYIYMRRPIAVTGKMIRLFGKIKKVNPGVKIIMEIPNYPYDDELGLSWINRPFLIKDKYNRRNLKNVIDRIAVQNDIDEVFGVKTIKFANAIKIEEIKPRSMRIRDDEIHICAVASLEPWQGYERIIMGLYKYYQKGGKRKIVIRIAGAGSEFKRYADLIQKLYLENKIFLIGKKNKSEVQELYDWADLALDAFGRYKTGNQYSTSLKSREYLAAGLPIVTGCETDVLNKDFCGFLQFDNDDTEIDIERIIQFYDKIYNKDMCVSEIIPYIREYAKSVCDISHMVEPLKAYISGINA